MATEKWLIDANDLLRRENEAYRVASGRGQIFEIIHRTILKLIQDAPTVDAVEVVHGEWEIIEDDYLSLVELKCSVCGESYGFEYYEDCIPQNYHYCPSCGAKMDGERKNK